MSELSDPEKQQQSNINNVSIPTYNNNHQQLEVDIPETKNKVHTQQHKLKDVKVHLCDIFKCHVRLARCKIEDSCQNASKNKDHDNQIKEFHEEREIEMQQHQSQASSEVIEKIGAYNADPYADDNNPMNTYIIIDLPWPNASQ